MIGTITSTPNGYELKATASFNGVIRTRFYYGKTKQELIRKAYKWISQS